MYEVLHWNPLGRDLALAEIVTGAETGLDVELIHVIGYHPLVFPSGRK